MKAETLKVYELISIQIFLCTPHNNDVRIWLDRAQTTTDSRHRNSQNRRDTQTLEDASEFAELNKDFRQLSSLYMIIHFCNEDWQECSEATVSGLQMTNLLRFFDTHF